MLTRKLVWQLFIPYVLITLVAVILVIWYTANVLRNFYLDQTSAQLASKISLLDEDVVNLLREGKYESIDHLCKERGKKAGIRITVVLPDGRVVGDTDAEPELMDNHGARPEVVEAFSKGFGKSIRFSRTVGQEMLYYAKVLGNRSGVVGIVRVAVPITAITQPITRLLIEIALAGLLVILVSAGIILAFARRISKPVEDMGRSAERFAKGELDHRIPLRGSEELSSLALSLNEMADKLHGTFPALLRKQNELNSILASMAEGVIAVSTKGVVLSINPACELILNAVTEKSVGRPIQEIVRIPALIDLVEEVLAGSGQKEGTITVHNGDERVLSVVGYAMKTPEGQSEGAVLVLRDITREKRIERIKRDFVANVSHELRTPITSIKGYAQTLLDGGAKDPETVQMFLGVIVKHANRLNQVLESLLTLARVERDADARSLQLEEVKISELLDSAVASCYERAERKWVKVTVKCEESLTERVNPQLLRLAVSNLVDNAIKFSNDGGTVEVEGKVVGEDLTISVKDYGIGIEEDQLERIFERFYTVKDVAREEETGAGLGLAIVKHIANAHKGNVSVKSELGKGTTFTLSLPRRPEA